MSSFPGVWNFRGQVLTLAKFLSPATSYYIALNILHLRSPCRGMEAFTVGLIALRFTNLGSCFTFFQFLNYQWCALRIASEGVIFKYLSGKMEEKSCTPFQIRAPRPPFRKKAHGGSKINWKGAWLMIIINIRSVLQFSSYFERI